MGTLNYIKNFLRDKDVAAITSSSSFLVKRVCRKIDFSRPLVIVEYGPGDGVFSKYILEHLTPDSKLILVEKNEGFVEELQVLAGDPRVKVVHDSVENVLQILDDAGEEAADYIISGIPFSFLNKEQKHQLLQDTVKALGSKGVFLAYQNYNHLEKPLRQHFESVDVEYELFNIPPMFAYEAIPARNGDHAER